jgi:hypothetical protein
MYHPALHLELARELARERPQHVRSAPPSTPRRRLILRVHAARSQQPAPSRARWA